MPLRSESATIADKDEDNVFVSGPGKICVKVFKRPGVASLTSIFLYLWWEGESAFGLCSIEGLLIPRLGVVGRLGLNF